jgi:long-chain acyl-CoA synthetase
MTRASCNVADFLLEGKPQDRVALHLLHEHKSYGELQLAANAFTSYFQQISCHKGERVILASENSFFWVSAYLGILRAGLVCVPLPTSITSEDLDEVVEVTLPRAAVVQTNFAAKHVARLGAVHLITDASQPEPCSDFLTKTQTQFAKILNEQSIVTSPSCDVGASDLAALMCTSGSTGKPRAVMVSHRNVIANTESIIQCLGLTESDRVMTVLPFHYCFGTSLLWTHLRVGASLVLESRFMYPETVLQRMSQTECTGFAGVPSHFRILLRSSSLRKKSLPHLRYVQQAGGALSPAFIRELKQILPNTQIFIMYGQTEATARLSLLPPEYLDNKIGSIGKGIPGVTLRVVHKTGRLAQPGEVGEIVAQAESITLGYWRDPVGTASKFRNGELHTGDLATVDADGFIYIVDRADDFLKCGGKRVSCRQIEQQLSECDEVLEAAVVGIPDEVLGEAVRVFVVSRTANRNDVEQALYTFCSKNMPSHLIPRDIVVVQALPKNDAGKVLKRKLSVE